MRAFSVLLLAGLALTAPPATARSGKGSSPKSHIALDDAPSGFRFGIHAVGGREFNLGYKLVSFERFQESYNTKNSALIRSPMGSMRPTGGWFYGIGLHGLSNYFISFYVDVIRSTQEASATASFNNGDARELRIVQKPVTTNIDLLMHLSRRVFFGIAIGVEQANSTLYSGYRYSNAFLSYGSDNALNGIYRSKDNRINIGIRTDISIIRQLRFTVRAEYCGAFAGKQDKESDYANTWSDQMYRQSASGGIHIDGENHFYMPEDVGDAYDDNVYFVGLGRTFAKTYRGWRITTGLVLDLFTHHN